MGDKVNTPKSNRTITPNPKKVPSYTRSTSGTLLESGPEERY